MSKTHEEILGDRIEWLGEFLMADIGSDRITAAKANASCNAGRLILKTVDMQYRYGSEKAGKTLRLA